MGLCKRKLLITLSLSAASILPIVLYADVTGANPGLTAAPGDDSRACTACHTGTSLNGGSGSVRIVLPDDASYTPGVTQHIKVQVSDSAQRRWGFELTARFSSNNAQAGDLTSTDSNTQVKCSNGRSKPCSASSPLQFITHTLAGTRLGVTGGAAFEFDWTPPATGAITLYAAGNAANGSNTESGDHIYTTKLSLSPASSSVNTKPAISGSNGVTNGASFQPAIAQNSWITITGTNLAAATRTWRADELMGGNLPTSLDGVGVSVNGSPAYVEYISPTQINAIAPADSSTGPVQVVVTSNGQTSDAVTATLQQFAPAFFTFDGKYLAATHADGTLVGKSGLFSAAPAATTPAAPGETIVLYGTGFGPTDPPVAPGHTTSTAATITTPFTVSVGGSQAAVSFAGLIPPYAALHQFNVVVPQGTANGDQSVTVQIGGAASPESANCCFITVRK